VTRPAGFTERFAKVDGVRLRYLMGGQGSPVVLLETVTDLAMPDNIAYQPIRAKNPARFRASCPISMAQRFRSHPTRSRSA